MVPILCLYGVSAHVFHAFFLLFNICLFYPLPSLAGLLSIEKEGIGLEGEEMERFWE